MVVQGLVLLYKSDVERSQRYFIHFHSVTDGCNLQGFHDPLYTALESTHKL